MRALANGILDRLRGGMHVVAREFVKFGVVGALAYVVDVGLFNLLRVGGPLADRPLTAKAVSVSVAVVVAWLGNRHWTFRRRGRIAVHHELLLFIAINAVGMLIALACLAVSHYVLDLRSAVADNISANVVGLVLGTAFRFYAYRTWVFTELPDPASELARARHAAADEGESRQAARRKTAKTGGR